MCMCVCVNVQLTCAKWMSESVIGYWKKRVINANRVVCDGISI